MHEWQDTESPVTYFSYIFIPLQTTYLSLSEVGYLSGHPLQSSFSHTFCRWLRFLLTMMTAEASLSAASAEVKGTWETLMSHIVQTPGLLLFSQQINRKDVQLESCSTLTSKHHYLFMWQLVKWRRSKAALEAGRSQGFWSRWDCKMHAKDTCSEKYKV